MNEILNRIHKIGIMPVAVLDDVKNAVPLAEALCGGGIHCVEIPLSTNAAEESIRIMTERFPQMLIGAGDILTAAQASLAVNAGAKFIISPEFSSSVVKYCMDRAIPVIPGVSTPADVETAISFGLDAVIVSSAGQDGGLHMNQTMYSSYNHINFIPADGINEKNSSSYPAFDNILACSLMVEQELIQAGESEKIRDLTTKAIQTMLGFEFTHIGINLSTDEEAEKTAGIFEAMFGFQKKSGAGSVFAGTAIECMKPPYFGTKGHIAISTNSIVRAKNYFETAGYKFNEASAKFNNDKMIVIYFEEEVGGFAVHILQR
ncbi:bifunctional 4-hydroxy-2-oxoglutarate aldolase/2-dehydro-3-deoxy-phosphogluconate aldolase [Lacrimispora sphenoides]|uniref:2-dehydro-3-deoxyphosphogluconate aldolase / (4S)-4-hydroxy-2-oxoglutarate aldolase n=1 Tax=Lacrimispora sphenoides JCM 1415 TaxID=1297793 RepID=A0ABY1C3Q2_9FIRM|nr:bifunctional 4-hydroxy-2-oxoglutarate aldolase/2-dehydro-3-deoxy-phosphogluconate aldolase [Lacrimispora sphenoides]SET61732.1 2-dehydro-3-deoxyphosphogluconate aldolase / (4S)-4-hydroxy-2-oxoglutarate aldolase [[Clostridium] sphenoides JCM 1415]SUY50082.1 2-dehydro-3-deoxyphosphooctonate aldolase [Lacrimispora sphenoides]